MILRSVALGCVIAALLSGCATSSSSGNVYPRQDTRTAYNVEYGEVVATRIVEIEGETSFVGLWGGATVGRAAGGALSGNGDTRRVAQAVGGVAGAVAGEAIEKEVTAEDGLEITVRLDNSDTIAVVQERDLLFAAGDRVRVLFGPRGEARVTPP